MKKIVMCLAIMMAIGVVAVGCSREKKEEVQTGSVVDKAQQPAEVVTEKAPMPVEVPKEQVGGAVPGMDQMGHEAVPQVETGQGVVPEGAGTVPGEPGAIKEETDQAVEAMPEGAGAVDDKAVVPAN